MVQSVSDLIHCIKGGKFELCGISADLLFSSGPHKPEITCFHTGHFVENCLHGVSDFLGECG